MNDGCISRDEWRSTLRVIVLPGHRLSRCGVSKCYTFEIFGTLLEFDLGNVIGIAHACVAKSSVVGNVPSTVLVSWTFKRNDLISVLQTFKL